MSDSDSSPQKEAETFLQNSEPPKRKKKAKRRANRAALEQKRQEIEMESFKEFASTVTADYLAEIFRFACTFYFYNLHIVSLQCNKNVLQTTTKNCEVHFNLNFDIYSTHSKKCFLADLSFCNTSLYIILKHDESLGISCIIFSNCHRFI